MIMIFIIIMCKSNESEVRRISSFVLTHELSLNDTKFRGYLCEISCLRKRNFDLTKFRRSENSRLPNFATTKFRWYNLWYKETESNANTQACIEEFTLIVASWKIRTRWREIRRFVSEFKASQFFLSSYIWCPLFEKRNLWVQRNNTLDLECKEVRSQLKSNFAQILGYLVRAFQ